MHERLLHAYFAESRDITDTDTLHALWCEAGLPAADFARAADPRLLRTTIDEHQEALRLGVNGVPAARMEGNEAFVTGAYPIEMYRRWVLRALERRAPGG